MLQRRRSNKNVLLISLVAILLAACGTTIAEPDVQEELPLVDEPVVEQAEAEVVEEAPQVEAAPEEVSEAFAPGFELGGSTLVSTDPSTVSLASGQIQVLEFFAFW